MQVRSRAELGERRLLTAGCAFAGAGRTLHLHMQHMTNGRLTMFKSYHRCSCVWSRLLRHDKYLAMSDGAYVNKPERRIRHLQDILTSGPRTFDAVVVGAGKLSENGMLRFLRKILRRRGSRCCWTSYM